MAQENAPHKQRAKIIAGFAGIGKTYFAETDRSKNVVDLDSTSFSHLSSGAGNPDFPSNYVSYIRDLSTRADVILVSAHPETLERLVENNLDFTLVYPVMAAKAEYLERYQAQGSTDAFIAMMDERWDFIIIRNLKQRGCNHVMLQSDQYLADVEDWILTDNDEETAEKEDIDIPSKPSTIDHGASLAINNSSNVSVTLSIGTFSNEAADPRPMTASNTTLSKSEILSFLMKLLFGVLIVMLCISVCLLEKERQVWVSANNISRFRMASYAPPPKSFLETVEKWVKEERTAKYDG